MICMSPSEMDIVLTILKTHAPEYEARAFGSRYKRTPKNYSDLDLALCGKEKMTFAQWGNLKEAFAESDLPFRVDVLDWHDVSPEFRAVIKRGYEVIYSPENDIDCVVAQNNSGGNSVGIISSRKYCR